MKKKFTGIKKESVAEKETSSENHFPIVAIGASAGGLAAITELLKNLPSDTGMAFIYVQHLSPDRKSLLPEILSKITKMEVHEIDDMEKIKPDNVFVIPHDKAIEAVDGHIKLIPRTKIGTAVTVNILFSTLAQAQQERVIGVILSGSASDGTQGMLAIKQEGGLTFAQDDTAKFTSMPHSAIAAGAVDFILSPKNIALELTRLSKHPYVRSNGKHIAHDVEIENNSPDLKAILNLLHKETGVDFSQYKMSTIKRRIGRRMLLYKIKSLGDYSKLLKEKKDEPEILYQDLLINVTAFFREAETYKYLKTTLLPKLLSDKQPGEPLRIWVAACATGEEVYSLAMMLLEIQSSKFAAVPLQIFATDLDAVAIAKARAGNYSKQSVDTLSPKRLERFFTKNNGSYRIAKNVRDICVFAAHNVLSDPPFAHLDLISCCNLLIYFDSAAQKKTLATFHYSLNPNGFLMLGKSESIGSSEQLFAGVNKKIKIFSRKNNITQRNVPALTPRRFDALIEKRIPVKGTVTKAAKAGINSTVDNAVNAVLLRSYMPASVVINSQLDVLQFRGTNDLFVSHPEGNASFNILKITRPEIALELRHTIAKTIKTKQTVRRADIELKINDVIRNVGIEVVPLKTEDDDPLFLVLFIEQHRTEIIDGAGNQTKNGPVALLRKLKKLEEELAHSRNNMFAYSQEQEAFTEELQSANEESVSSNEELQTLNEELATSKEEIESALEELNTTNQELQTRNDQLIEIQRYSETIIATVPLPLVILDRDLRVKSANKAFYKKFLVTQEHTEKNRLYDLGNHQWNIPALRTLLEEIIPDNTTFADYYVEHKFEHIGEKVMLLNAKQIEIEKEKLILLAISDITEHSKAQARETQALEESISRQKEIAKALKFADEYIRNVFMQAPSAIVVYKGSSFIVDLVNEKALEMWGTAYENTINQPLFEIMPHLYQSLEKLLTKVYMSGEPYIASELPIQFTRNGKTEEGVFNIVLNPFHDVNGTIIGITSISTDVTTEVTARKRIEENEILFQFIADSMPQKVWTADAEGNRNYFNKQWLDYTGNSLEELKNGGWKKVLHPDDMPNTEKRWQQSLETGNDFEMEDRKLDKDGNYKWHLSRAAAFRDETGKIKMWIGTNTEVEKQKMKALEFENAVKDRTKELQYANEELQKMNKELESFTYVSSHDLQEPLRKIQTFTTRILEKESQNLSDQGKDYFHRMQEAAKRMQTLIQDLLAFSRINSTERQFELTNLNNIVEEVKKDLKETIDEKQARIETKELSGEALINHFQFRQLLYNLISNALKFSKPGVPPLITIKSEILAAYPAFAGQACHIAVTDNGIGFEQHFSDKIFEVFQKLHGKEEFPGTGIGLAIVKKIVNNHNGIITATSRLGKGTTFDIYIPAG